jgi:hypothetical protein
MPPSRDGRRLGDLSNDARSVVAELIYPRIVLGTWRDLDQAAAQRPPSQHSLIWGYDLEDACCPGT